MKLDRTGLQLVFSSYLGGSNFDDSFGISVDLFQRVTVTGETCSTDFPTQNPVQPIFGGGGSDGFVAIFNRSGSQLVLSTYLGSSGFDFTGGVATVVFSNLYVTGDAGAADFPTVNPLQPHFGGFTDAFIAKICNPFEQAEPGCAWDGHPAGAGLSKPLAPSHSTLPSEMAWREKVLECKRAGHSPLDPVCR